MIAVVALLLSFLMAFFMWRRMTQMALLELKCDNLSTEVTLLRGTTGVTHDHYAKPKA